jgi:hypothetical protein
MGKDLLTENALDDNAPMIWLLCGVAERENET